MLDSPSRVSNAVSINIRDMIRFADAVQIVHERIELIDALEAEPDGVGVSLPNSEWAGSSAQERKTASDTMSHISFFREKTLIVDWLCEEALLLFARKPLRAEDGGFTDWKVPPLSRPRHYLRGLRVLPLGSETDPWVQDLWRSEKYLDRSAFFELLNATLPLPKGEWTVAAEGRAVETLTSFLRAQPNSRKEACLEHLRALYPSIPATAFKNRIWAKGRAAAGLSEKASAGRKPVD